MCVNSHKKLQDMMTGRNDKQSHYKIISFHWHVTTYTMLQYATFHALSFRSVELHLYYRVTISVVMG